MQATTPAPIIDGLQYANWSER
ncbi:MAG: hypothetical protein K0S81_2658, partial [Rhodospirillales bacterium]|nr:hypothetical protein [Rhodospirillales bacterium]